jgi:hypothetical protein
MMKKDCGCSDYNKCEHEIAQVGATPKEAESKDGKQEPQPEMKQSKKELEKGVKNFPSKLKPASKPKMGLTPEGKKYQDLDDDELAAHMHTALGISPKKPSKESEHAEHEYLASSEKAKDLDKGDVIDLKSKAKTAGQKPSASASKAPDARTKDQKIKDALDSQASKGSPYATPRASTTAKEPPKPGIHAGMSRQELMAQVDKSPEPRDPKPPTPKPKVLKSLEALAPKFHKGMSMAELKKAEEQYSGLRSKVEQLLAKGDVEAIKIALEKIRGFNK